MIYHEGNLTVQRNDICWNCSKCYICDNQYSIADTLKSKPDCIDVSFTIDNCTKFLPIEATKPTNGSINDLIKWRKGK